MLINNLSYDSELSSLPDMNLTLVIIVERAPPVPISSLVLPCSLYQTSTSNIVPLSHDSAWLHHSMLMSPNSISAHCIVRLSRNTIYVHHILPLLVNGAYFHFTVPLWHNRDIPFAWIDFVWWYMYWCIQTSTPIYHRLMFASRRTNVLECYSLLTNQKHWYTNTPSYIRCFTMTCHGA